VLAALVWISRHWRTGSSQGAAYRQLGLGIAALALLLLTGSGRLPWPAALLLAALPALWVLIPAARRRLAPAAAAGPPPGQMPMTRQEALAVLGLQDSATPAEIKHAHRQLIQRLHPDRGGSPYLAAAVNRAKDLLLS